MRTIAVHAATNAASPLVSFSLGVRAFFCKIVLALVCANCVCVAAEEQALFCRPCI